MNSFIDLVSKLPMYLRAVLQARSKHKFVEDEKDRPSKTKPLDYTDYPWTLNTFYHASPGGFINDLLLWRTPARYLGGAAINKGAYKLGLPVPITHHTEYDLTPQQLSVIDDQVRKRAKEMGITASSFKSDNDTIRTTLSANAFYPKHYGRAYVPKGLPLWYRQYNPLDQVEHFLGDYGIKYYNNGYTVTDLYDFNAGKGNYNGSNEIYPLLRRSAGKIMSSEDIDYIKDRFNIKRTVNHW